MEVKKGKGKNVQSISSYQWETVDTNLDEFQGVSVSLTRDFFVFSSLDVTRWTDRIGRDYRSLLYLLDATSSTLHDYMHLDSNFHSFRVDTIEDMFCCY
nr:hypothetical protein [Tanacetum cinerariifolium]